MIPEGYRNILGSMENTEKAIKAVKDMFQDNLSAQLALLRVTAPMVVMSGMGLNDDLNGVESPVVFPVKDMDGSQAEIVHSLAKWKRVKLAQMKVPEGRGIYTDMNALRPEEELDNMHSIYVDQWDWEKVITPGQRSLEFLKKTVRRIYEAIKVTENKLYVEFPQIEPMLPEDIFFIHAEELLQMYPGLNPKEREDAVVKEHKAVFIIGIGDYQACLSHEHEFAKSLIQPGQQIGYSFVFKKSLLSFLSRKSMNFNYILHSKTTQRRHDLQRMMLSHVHITERRLARGHQRHHTFPDDFFLQLTRVFRTTETVHLNAIHIFFVIFLNHTSGHIEHHHFVAHFYQSLGFAIHRALGAVFEKSGIHRELAYH